MGKFSKKIFVFDSIDFSGIFFCVSNLTLTKFDMKFDLIITLSYILLDNFCPCFYWLLALISFDF